MFNKKRDGSAKRDPMFPIGGVSMEMIAATLAASLPAPEISSDVTTEDSRNIAMAKARVAQYQQIVRSLEYHKQQKGPK